MMNSISHDDVLRLRELVAMGLTCIGGPATAAEQDHRVMRFVVRAEVHAREGDICTANAANAIERLTASAVERVTKINDLRTRLKRLEDRVAHKQSDVSTTTA